MRLAAATVTLLLAASAATATIIHVPGDQPTIQAGLGAATPGDTVEVACGTYFEHDLVLPSGVILRSTTGLPDCVTIDAQSQGRVLSCSGADNTTCIAGFTIEGGAADEVLVGFTAFFKEQKNVVESLAQLRDVFPEIGSPDAYVVCQTRCQNSHCRHSLSLDRLIL